MSFDKSTYKHRPRQFVASMVVVPDSDQLIVPIALGVPVCSGTFGVDFAESAKKYWIILIWIGNKYKVQP